MRLLSRSATVRLVTDDNSTHRPNPVQERPQTLYTYPVIEAALSLVTWCAASDRAALESPNYALEQLGNGDLVQVHEMIAYRMGLTSNGSRLDRRVCAEALGWVENELLSRMARDLADSEPF